MNVVKHEGKIAALTLLVAGLSAGTALAGGFQLREDSAAAMGNAYAGAAAAGEDSSTIWYNPAAMTRLKGNQVSGTATLVMPYAQFHGTGMPGGSMPGDAIIDAVTGANYAFWDYSSDLKFGVGVTVPFGLRSTYKNGWVGAPYAMGSAVTNIVVNPSMAYRISPNLSIGAGIDFSYIKAELSQELGWNGSIPAPYANMKGNDIGLGFNFGVLWEFSPSTRLGLAYRSQIEHTLMGQLTVLLPNAHPIPGYEWQVQAGFDTPATISAGLVHDVDPKLSLKLEAEWTQWSTFKQLAVTDRKSGILLNYQLENWRDTWFVSAGADYKVLPGHTLRLGTAWDQTPVPDATRTARVPDSSRIWATAGWSWDFNKDLRLDLSYAHLFGIGSGSINETKSGIPVPLVGHYDSHADLISTGFVYKF